MVRIPRPDTPATPDDPAPGARGADSASAAGARILIIGADTVGFETIVRAAGYEVSSAASGRHGIAAAAERHPDLVLMDLELDGPVAALDAAAAIGASRPIPIIYVIDESADDPSPQVRRTEPSGYLVTPCSPRQLLLSIDAALRRHHREMQYVDHAELLESALDSAAEGVVVTDQKCGYLYVNRRAEEIVGSLITETDPDKWHSEYGTYQLDGTTPFPLDELPLIRALAGHESDDVRLLLRNERRPEGVYVSVSGRPLLRGKTGGQDGAVVVFHDITRLMAVEDELHEAIEDQRRQIRLTDTVLNSIADALIVTGPTGEIVMTNSAVERIFGTIPAAHALDRRSASYGLHYPDTHAVIPADDLPTARALRGEKTHAREIFVRNELRPDGAYVSVNGSPMYDRSGELTGSVIVIRDVTELRTTATRLRETTDQVQAQNRTMEAIFNSISDGVVVADETGRFLMFNPSAERIVGVGATDTRPDQWSERYGVFYTDTVTPVPTGELPLTRAINGDSCDEVELFVCNERVPQGAYISVSGRPMRDAEGNSKGGVIVFRDVTERIRADQALTQAFAQGRLEVVDTIMHNIGNAINSVSIGIGTIAQELRRSRELRRLRAVAEALDARRGDWPEYIATDPRGRRVLPLILALAADFEEQRDRLTRTVERIGGRVAHIVDIIRTQKSFDDGAMVRKVVEVRGCINDGIKVLSESLRSRGIRLRVDCRGAPKEIWIQENKLHQALVNLVKNSIEAIDEQARSAPLDEPSIDIRCYRQDDYLVIDIVDNGIGITDTHSRLIFSAGYSTKEGGSGLGLHSAANFVIGSGGRILALSDGAGTGTTMRLMLRNWMRR